MAVHTLEAPLPMIELEGGQSIVFEAVDPSTGAAVAGVTISNIVIYGKGNIDRQVEVEPQPVFLLGGGD